MVGLVIDRGTVRRHDDNWEPYLHGPYDVLVTDKPCSPKPPAMYPALFSTCYEPKGNTGPSSGAG